MEKINSKNKNNKISLAVVLLILVFIFMVIPISRKMYIYFADKSLAILRPDSITLSFHNFYSKKTKDSVAKFISDYLTGNEINKIDVIFFNRSIVKEFDFVKNVEWDFSSPENVEINIFGKKPLYFLNDNKIISDDRSIFELNIFNDFNPVNCMKVYLSEYNFKKKLSESKFSFFGKLPDYLWKNFKIDYQNKYHVILTSLENKIPRKNRFLFTKKNIFDDEKLLYASSVFENLFKLNKLFRDKKYLLDLRFENRILLRNDRGIG